MIAAEPDGPDGLATGIAYQATCVALSGRAIVIEGSPGSGKSALALSLIDRGAQLVGDDSVLLERRLGRDGERLIAHPHPNTRGRLEVRNLGLLPFPCLDAAWVALVIALDPAAPRYVEGAQSVIVAGVTLPFVRLWPDGAALPLKAELALERFGLPA